MNNSLSQIVESGSATLSLSAGDATIPYTGDGTKIFVTCRTRAIDGVGYIIIGNAEKQTNGFLLMVYAVSTSGINLMPNGTIKVNYIICK